MLGAFLGLLLLALTPLNLIAVLIAALDPFTVWQPINMEFRPAFFLQSAN